MKNRYEHPEYQKQLALQMLATPTLEIACRALVDVHESRLQRVIDALDLVAQYGGTDGGHHKQWVLDQVVRALTTTPEAYAAWVLVQKGNVDETGNFEYDWDEGIAP